MRPHLTAGQRRLALRLKARGLSLRETGPQAGCSHQGVALVVRRASRRPARHERWVPGPGRLTPAGREEIAIGLHAGQSFTAVAARLGKAVPAVPREVAANGGRQGYRAWRAHQRAREQARRLRVRAGLSKATRSRRRSWTPMATPSRDSGPLLPLHQP